VLKIRFVALATSTNATPAQQSTERFDSTNIYSQQPHHPQHWNPPHWAQIDRIPN
jgi:hypothetical protein